jgi:hypothetical protein
MAVFGSGQPRNLRLLVVDEESEIPRDALLALPIADRIALTDFAGMRHVAAAKYALPSTHAL